jgi:hypothetical protein
MDDPNYQFSRDIPLSDPRLLKPKKGCDDADADGLRLTHWAAGAVLVSFSTCDPVVFPPAPGRPAVLGPDPRSNPPPPPPPIRFGEWAVELWQHGKQQPQPQLLRRVPVDPAYTSVYETHYPDRRPNKNNSYAGGYRSGRISHVLLDGLEPGGQAYSYRVVVLVQVSSAATMPRLTRRFWPFGPPMTAASSAAPPTWQPRSPLIPFESPWRADQLPASVAAAANAAANASSLFYRLGFVGDPGQTPDTARTIQALAATSPRTIVLVGDISYADDFTADGAPMAGGSVPLREWYTQPGQGEQTFEYKFDTSARLWAPVASRVPMLTTPGNHDYSGHNFTDIKTKRRFYFLGYNARFPVPNGGGGIGNWSWLSSSSSSSAPMMMFPREQLDAVPTPPPPPPKTSSSSPPTPPPTNLFYSTETPGALLLFVTPYLPGDWGPGSAQFEFARRTLATVNRTRTPWVIVATHGNLYSTYRGHFKELECFRLAYEPLFLEHRVDLVINGHTHAYERFHPSADYKLDPCGIVHITVGDAGNIEGLDGMVGIEQDPEDLTRGGWQWTCADYANRPAPDPGGGGRKLNCVTEQPEYAPSFGGGGGDGARGGKNNNTTATTNASSSSSYCWTIRPPISAFRKPSFGFGTLDIYSATAARWTWRANSKQGGRGAPAREPVRDEVWLTRGDEADAKAGCRRRRGGRD